VSFSDDGKCLHCHAKQRPLPLAKFRRHRCVVCHWAHRGGAPKPPEVMLRICRRCHGTAEVTISPEGFDFHENHRGPTKVAPRVD
jgi:hypothetical protein